jgi:lysophospholipase L1-like esterase
MFRLSAVLGIVLSLLVSGQADAATRTIIVGDSVALGNSVDTNTAVVEGTRTWFTHFLLKSHGRATFLWNAARGGTTSTQWLTWYQAEVLDRHPDLVVIQAPTTDPNRGVSMSQTESNIQSMVDQAETAGAQVAIANVLPRPTGHGYIAAINSWLVTYCAGKNIPLIDSYSQLVDSASGNLQAQYDNGDGIHPNAAGAAVIGANAANTLAPILDPTPAYLTVAMPDSASLVRDGLFTADRNKDGKPDNWSLPAVTHASYSVGARSGTAGQMLEVSRNGSSTDPTVVVDQPLRGWVAGDTLALAAHVRVSGSIAKYALRLVYRTGTGVYQYAAVGAGRGPIRPAGFAYISGVVPAGTTRVDVQVVVPGGAGSVQVGQVTVTRL